MHAPFAEFTLGEARAQGDSRWRPAPYATGAVFRPPPGTGADAGGAAVR